MICYEFFYLFDLILSLSYNFAVIALYSALIFSTFEQHLIHSFTYSTFIQHLYAASIFSTNIRHLYSALVYSIYIQHLYSASIFSTCIQHISIFFPSGTEKVYHKNTFSLNFLLLSIQTSIRTQDDL